jgi:hypothetical protein
MMVTGSFQSYCPEISDRKRKGYKPLNLFMDRKKCPATLFKPPDLSVG